MKKLCELVNCDYDIDIYGVSSDSRNIKQGYLFVATKGFYVDHFNYIDDAINRGAVAIIVDRDVTNIDSIPVIVVSDLDKELVSICEKFYDVSANDFNFIGITGTDGKTTTATFIRNLLNNFTSTAYIGTNGVMFGDKIIVSNNTTPCVEELYSYFSTIKKYDCKVVVMEVSSEALLHRRVDNISFDVVGYTNITEDHLNVHKNIDNYINCKKCLVDLVKPNGHVFINGDDDNCKTINVNNMKSYGFNSDNDFVIHNVNIDKENVNFSIKCKDKSYVILSPFLGKHNIYNMTLAFIISLTFGYSEDDLVKQIQTLDAVRGRCEYLDFNTDYAIILDYAHTVNGVKNILQSVKGYKRIITVTGAAGGREKEKRSIIGNMVLNNSDLVVFTMDDPRYEDVDDIIDQMIGNSIKTNYIRIIDRKEAIYYALNYATTGDLVLILGKGRDNYMAIGNKKIPYCDYDVVSEYFK